MVNIIHQKSENTSNVNCQIYNSGSDRFPDPGMRPASPMVRGIKGKFFRRGNGPKMNAVGLYDRPTAFIFLVNSHSKKSLFLLTMGLAGRIRVKAREQAVVVNTGAPSLSRSSSLSKTKPPAQPILQIEVRGRNRVTFAISNYSKKCAQNIRYHPQPTLPELLRPPKRTSTRDICSWRGW